jgi:hypothetical protein
MDGLWAYAPKNYYAAIKLIKGGEKWHLSLSFVPLVSPPGGFTWGVPLCPGIAGILSQKGPFVRHWESYKFVYSSYFLIPQT